LGLEESDYFLLVEPDRFSEMKELLQSSFGRCTANAYQKAANIAYSIGLISLKPRQVATRTDSPDIKPRVILKKRTRRKAPTKKKCIFRCDTNALVHALKPPLH